jgi:hypothetical protein
MGPSVRVTSTDALRPSSARSGRGTSNRDSPAASVSSVSGDGPKNPVPNETLPVQAPPRKSADALGLKNVPYSLSRSSRPLALSDSHVATSTSSCTNTHGNREDVLESRNVDRPIVITFQRRAGDERVTSDRRTQRQFTKCGLVPIALAYLTSPNCGRPSEKKRVYRPRMP